VTLPPAQIREFYERSYTDTDAGWLRRWRALGAGNKADHVCRLIEQLPRPATVLEVGCGDGAVLSELADRGVGETRTGVEISAAAVALAAERTGVTAAHVFDGEVIDAGRAAFDLVICTHVLEHVVDPRALLRELERVGRAIVLEVPLERNLAARRATARALSERSGHLHRFDRATIRSLIYDTGWQVRGELLDPLPHAIHSFRATTPKERLQGHLKWAIRAALGALPGVGERLFTMHYALLATPRRPAGS
jgi:SAM-dependent methyltransferase